MTISEIISNALDLAGGSIVREKLDFHQGLLACLNILKTMSLELANSGKMTTGFFEDFSFAAGASEGTFTPASKFSTDKKIFLIRSGDSTNSWRVLPQATSFGEITDADRAGRQRIFWTGTSAPYNYYLSWSPSEIVSVRVWVKRSWSDVAALTDESPTPQDLDLVVVYRLVGYFLNQLLLIDAPRYQPFVVAQTGLIMMEKRRLDHIWRVYLAEPADTLSVQRVEPYEMRDEWGETFDTGNETLIW